MQEPTFIIKVGGRDTCFNPCEGPGHHIHHSNIHATGLTIYHSLWDLLVRSGARGCEVKWRVLC